MIPSQTLTAIYDRNNKAFLSVNDTWEKILKIKSLSLDFMPSDLKAQTGGNSVGEIDFTVTLERMSQVFKGIKTVKKTIASECDSRFG